MKRFLSAAVLLAAVPALSQGGPGMMGHGPAEFAGSMRAPVSNAPYTATFTTTSTEKLQDGTVLNHSRTRTMSRDSLGRTREETTLPARGNASQTRTSIVIFDPVSRTVTQLRAGEKVAVVHALPQPGPDAGMRGPRAGTNGPQANAGQPGDHPRGPHGGSNVVKTDLGAKTIAGVVAQGTRITRTVPAGEMGNAAPIVSTHEQWFSPDLKIEVSRTDTDPFHGTDSTVATALVKVEPDAALFHVPGDYTVKQAPERAFGRRGSGGAQHPGNPAPPSTGAIVPAPGA